MDVGTVVVGLTVQGVVVSIITTFVNLGIFARPKEVDTAKAEAVDRDDKLRKELSDAIEKTKGELQEQIDEHIKDSADKYQTKELCTIKHDQIAKMEAKVDKLDERIGNIERQNSTMGSTIDLIHDTMNRLIKIMTGSNSDQKS